MTAETTVLRGGLVVDGTGALPYEADVAVAGGRIVEVGTGLRGDLELDAGDAVVAPGFIDLHTHYDAQVLWERAVTPSAWHGVTTVVLGNCGFGIAPCRPEHRELLVTMLEELEDMPRDVLEAGIDWSFETFPEYLDVVDGLGLHVNAAAFVGHSPVRFEVMGAAAYERAATDDEIARMVTLVRAGIDAGAVGFATSSSPTGRHHPTSTADRREVAALTHVLADAGRGIGSFVPGHDIDQLYELQREVGRPFTYTALMSKPDLGHRAHAERHLAELATGARVHPQVSCRPLVFQSTLRSAFALRAPAILAIEHVDDETRLAAYADPAFRQQVEEQIPALFTRPDWHRWRVETSATRPDLVGVTIDSLAAARGVSSLDAVLDLVVDDRLDTRFRITVSNDDEAEVAALINLDGAVLGLADSGAHPDQICDAVFPTDLLGRWVRELEAMSLERAVRMLTGQVADLLGFTDRGYVRPGAVADLVVFEPGTVGPGPIRRIRDLPGGHERLAADRPEGLRHIVVGGTTMRRDSERAMAVDAPGPGRIVRPGQNQRLTGATRPS